MGRISMIGAHAEQEILAEDSGEDVEPQRPNFKHDTLALPSRSAVGGAPAEIKEFQIPTMGNPSLKA